MAGQDFGLLRVVGFRAENVKHLKAVEFEPGGGVQVIAGANGAGKTSILDAVDWGIRGAKHFSEIRDGEETATVQLVLGHPDTGKPVLIIDRATNKGEDGKPRHYLHVTDASTGAEFSKPQGLLSALFTLVTFDPFSFAALSAREQVDQVLRLGDTTFDIDKARALDAGERDARRDVGRDLKKAEAQEVVRHDLPADAAHKNITELMESRRELQRRWGDNQAMRSELASEERELESRKRKVEEATEAVERANARLIEANLSFASRSEEVVDLRAKVESLEDPDFTAVDQEILSVEDWNSKIADNEAAALSDAEVEELRARWEAHDNKIKAIAVAAGKAAESVDIGVEGFSATLDGVTLNGHPLEDCSAAEQRTFSASIAMYGNPSLRVMKIVDGSLLDDDAIKWLEDFAKKHKFQVWLEMVRTSPGQESILIEDGEIADTE